MHNPSSSAAHALNPGIMPASRSAVSWASVIAGAAIAAAVSAMLVIGGAGLGFLSMSPWDREGASGAALAIGSIAWLLASQIIAYGIAGYVAGRLRTKWADADPDEIYFRDTAHGLLVWALSAVLGIVLLGSAMASIVSGTAKAGASLAGGTAQAAVAVAGGAAGASSAGNLPLDYFTDALLRPDNATAPSGQTDARQEVARILVRGAVNQQLPDSDRSYLIKLVARQAGMDEAGARARLTQIEGQIKQAADQAEQKTREAADAARKAAVGFSLWAFASLLIGAFVASLAATIGGRARDR